MRVTGVTSADNERSVMTTCRCCGRPLEAGAQITYDDDTRTGDLRAELGRTGNEPIWVESNVLACCNAAYERARLAARAEVSLCDLLHAIASGPTLAAWLAAYDIDRDLLRIEIEATSPDDLASLGLVRGSPLTSVAMIRDAPAARQIPTAKIPIGPQPVISTVLPGIEAVSAV